MSQRHSVTHTFKRREFIRLDTGMLWQIETGTVRALTLTEDGTPISLGFWGAGDVVGQLLSRIHPYQIECLSEVEAFSLTLDECWNLNQVMLAHIHQMQELLRIRCGHVSQRLYLFLEWLSYKFGRETEAGRLLTLRLTHQHMADTIGTTRVTITRLLRQFEQEGAIRCSGRHHILLHCHQSHS